MANLSMLPSFIDEIREAQREDEKIKKMAADPVKAKEQGFEKGSDGIWRFGKRLCVPSGFEVKELIFREAHKSRYTIHPGGTKIYQNLRETF